MLKNNVKILLQKDIIPYEKYFKEHYDESEIVETKKRIYRSLIEDFNFKCIETNEIYNSVTDMDKIMKFCCPKNRNVVNLSNYIKACCNKEKEYYKHFHFEYV
jgi:hypothetical protein